MHLAQGRGSPTTPNVALQLRLFQRQFWVYAPRFTEAMTLGAAVKQLVRERPGVACCLAGMIRTITVAPSGRWAVEVEPGEGATHHLMGWRSPEQLGAGQTAEVLGDLARRLASD